MNWRDIPFIARIRRNHGLEHATIHTLAQQNPRLNVVGRTTLGGFYLYGSLTTKQVRAAVEKAIAQLQNGETHLAIHPRCGTNLATAGFLAGLSAFIALLPRARRRLDQLPFAILAATLATIAAQPLGLILQAQVTTSPDVRNLIVKRVTCRQQSPIAIHYVETASY